METDWTAWIWGREVLTPRSQTLPPQIPQHRKIIGSGDHIRQQGQQRDPGSGEGGDVEIIGQEKLSCFADVRQGHPTRFSRHGVPGKQTVLPGVHTQLVDAGGRLGEDVDGTAGAGHVVEEEDGKCRQGEHQEPDHGQEIRDHDEGCAEAAAAHCAPELPERLPRRTGGVKTLSQQSDAVQEEKGGQAVDDVLEILDKVGEGDVILWVASEVVLYQSLGLS